MDLLYVSLLMTMCGLSAMVIDTFIFDSKRIFAASWVASFTGGTGMLIWWVIQWLSIR